MVRCRDCTLMQISEVVDPDIIFAGYSYASSTTHTLSSHFARMARDLVALGVTHHDLVLEFGCNDGVLIRPLRHLGVKAVGVDPSDVARRASEAEGWPLVPGYFDAASASQVLSTYGRAKVVVANNVFAHIDDLDGTMSVVSDTLRQDGFFVIEVHYQGDLIRDFQFDTVYHEHLCYYSLSSLITLLDRFDFSVIGVHPIPIHSGSIRVVAAPKSANRPVSDDVARTLVAETNWDVAHFVAGVQRRCLTLRKLIQDLRSSGRSIVGYGAAGRATVLLNYCQFGPKLIDYVVDMSPLRHGRLVPGVRVPVCPPATFHDRYPEYALMTAWNYETEIVKKEHEFLEAGGRFIIPLPEVRISDGL
jgi:methylation protein EvaC